MRIGIITFHDAVNYGAVLQCYALSQYLGQCGHEVEVIDYHRLVAKQPGAPRRRLMDYPRLILRKLRVIAGRRSQDDKRRIFQEFVARQLPLTQAKYLGIDALRADPPQCDAYICGSDQIWNDRFWNGFDEGYFLRFGGEAVRRIAYAPGVPGSEFERAGIGRFKELIADFNALSAREGIGQGLIEQATGESAPVVTDPTILFGEYSDVLKPVEAPADYILSYGLPAYDTVEIQADDCVKQLKQASGFPVVAIKMGVESLLKKKVYSPFEWLWLIKNASQFVTNSYHGLIFSILFQQDVYVVPRDADPNGQDARLLFLLNRYGLSERYITDPDQMKSVSPIDWARVSSLIEKDRSFSREFLEQALACDT
jgi:hypothetical protein